MCACKKIGTLNRNGMEAMNEGRLSDAVQALSQAIEMAWDLGSAVHEARIRNNLALVFQAQGNPGAAEDQLRLALDKASGKLGRDNRLCATIMRNLGVMRSQAA